MTTTPTIPRRDPLALLDALTEQIGAYGADVAQSPIGELAPSHALVDAIKAVRASIGELQETLDLAWGLIANAGDGDWSKESDQWRQAAERWRDERLIPRILPASVPLARGLARLEAISALMIQEAKATMAELEGGLAHQVERVTITRRPFDEPRADATIRDLSNAELVQQLVDQAIDFGIARAKDPGHVAPAIVGLRAELERRLGAPAPRDVFLDATGRALDETAELAQLGDFVRRGQAAQAAVDEILEPHDPGRRVTAREIVDEQRKTIDRMSSPRLEPLPIVDDRSPAQQFSQDRRAAQAGDVGAELDGGPARG